MQLVRQKTLPSALCYVGSAAILERGCYLHVIDPNLVPLSGKPVEPVLTFFALDLW